MKKIIDIHCHLLYGVDDGAQDRTEAVEMLKRAKQQGIETLTPNELERMKQLWGK